MAESGVAHADAKKTCSFWISWRRRLTSPVARYPSAKRLINEDKNRLTI